VVLSIILTFTGCANRKLSSNRINSPAVYQLEGRFRAQLADSSSVQLLVLVSSDGKLFIEARKTGFTLFQGSYTEIATLERSYRDGEWSCSGGGALNQLQELIGLPLLPKQLATMLYLHQKVDDQEFSVRFLHHKAFAAGELPSLVLFKQKGELKASFRVSHWKAKDLDDSYFNISQCE
jgi:hypothetical protein